MKLFALLFQLIAAILLLGGSSFARKFTQVTFYSYKISNNYFLFDFIEKNVSNETQTVNVIPLAVIQIAVPVVPNASNVSVS